MSAATSSASKTQGNASLAQAAEDSRHLEQLDAQGRIAWALERFDERIVLSSSFGAQSAVMLHLATEQAPNIPVVLVDTGYLFPETYQFVDQLTDRLKLNLKVYQATTSPAWQEARFGKQWENGVEGIEAYNQRNKVEPMERGLTELGAEATLAGIRRQQSSTRENLPFFAKQRGRYKVHPILDWTDMDIGMYLTDHDLPYHPLWDEGYLSIGDWHSSKKLTDGMSVEETRFGGLKRECGLHEDLDFVI